MAKNQTRRLPPSILQADQEAGMALNALRDYQPYNPEYGREVIQTKLEAMKAAQETEINLRQALAAARDAANTAEWDYHNTILGAKQQVLALYGEDSDQVQSLGIRKKSERKHPGPRKKA